MPSDFRDALRKAAPAPRTGLDLDRVLEGGRRLRVRRAVAAVLSAAALVGGGAITVRAAFPDTPKVTPPAESAPFVPEPRANGRIAFVRSANVSEGEPALLLKSTLFTIAADGTGVTEIGPVDPFSFPAWAPDGSKIAFVRNGIRVMSLESGAVTKLCERPCKDPTWSPDGRALAFIRERSVDGEIWVVDEDGGSARRLLQESPIHGPLAWSPDGELIAAALRGDAPTGSDESMVLVDAETGKTVRTIPLPSAGFISGLAWSPDARQIVFAGHGSGRASGVYLVDRDGTGLERVTSCPESGCDDVFPGFSPDGRFIVFTRARCSEPGGDCSFGDILVIPLDGDTPRPVTSGRHLDCCAVWQPVLLSAPKG